MKPIYSDNHLLILNKPAGIATQPDFHETAKLWVKEAFSKPGNVFLEPVHRLDKPVSGIVLFARTSKALSRLNHAMRKHQIHKTYLAKVEGELFEEGILEHYLTHGNFRALIDPKGKKAILRYRLLKKFEKSSLIEVELETGRYHQIRAQFSAIGHPVVGDGKYGSCENDSKIALHHQKLVFAHPITKETLTFQCPAEFTNS